MFILFDHYNILEGSLYGHIIEYMHVCVCVCVSVLVYCLKGMSVCQHFSCY